MRCIGCGCTDDNACTRSQGTDEPVVCQWVHEEGDPPLCSFCSEIEDQAAEQGFGLVNDYNADELVTTSRELILPGDPEFHL